MNKNVLGRESEKKKEGKGVNVVKMCSISLNHIDLFTVHTNKVI